MRISRHAGGLAEARSASAPQRVVEPGPPAHVLEAELGRAEAHHDLERGLLVTCPFGHREAHARRIDALLSFFSPLEEPDQSRVRTGQRGRVS